MNECLQSWKKKKKEKEVQHCRVGGPTPARAPANSYCQLLDLAQFPVSLEFSSLFLAQIPDRREAVTFEQVKLLRDAFHALRCL